MQIEIRPAVKVFFSRVCLLLSVRIKKQTVTNEHGQQRKTTATTADHRTANNGTANAARVRTKNSDSRSQAAKDHGSTNHSCAAEGVLYNCLTVDITSNENSAC